MEKLRAVEIDFEVVSEVGMIRIKSPRDVTKLPGFAEGLFTIQDITASKPVRNLEFRMKNEKFSILNSQFSILDLCAAPGTKTTQLAEATGDSSTIIATDIDPVRLEMVGENIARLGIQSADVVPYEQLCNSKFDIRYSTFDFVLLDVPCSNTGVMARRVEVRYRIKTDRIDELSRSQAELLKTAARLVKAGGKICYSTCSIQKSENSQIVEKFLEKNKNFKLETEQLTLPSAEGFDHDGGYAAIITKRKN